MGAATVGAAALGAPAAHAADAAAPAPAGAASAPGAGEPAAPATASPAPATAPVRVEVTGAAETDVEQRRRDPVGKTVVGRDELERYGDTSVSDVLKRQPGVNLSGGNPRLRGLGAGYTLILVNGEPAPPGFSLENLSPSQVERIEITKGPSAEYSTRAVAGTINIVLRQAPRRPQREARLSLRQQAAAVDPSFHGVWGDAVGELSYSLPLSLFRWHSVNESVSLRASRDAAGLPQTLASEGWDAGWGYGASASPRATWKLSPAHTLELGGSFHRSAWRNAGHSEADVLLGSAPISVDDNWANRGHWGMARGDAKWTWRTDSGARWELRGLLQQSSSHYRTTVDGRDGAGVQTIDRLAIGHNRERVGSSGLKWRQTLDDTHALVAGIEWEGKRRSEQRTQLENGLPELAGLDGLPFSARVERSAAFVQDEANLTDRWGATLGLRAERITTEGDALDGLAGSRFHNRSQVVSPLLHVVHKFDAKGRDQIRLGLTRAYKAPELAQLLPRPAIAGSYPVSGGNAALAPDRAGNPQLSPELSTGLDLALEHYVGRGGVLSVGLFHRRVSGLIRQGLSLEPVSWSPVPRWVQRPVNLGRADSTGIELEAKGRVDEWWDDAPALLKAANLRGALSIYRSRVAGVPGPDNRLDAQQPWSASLGFDHPWPATGITWGASASWTPAYFTQVSSEQRTEQGQQRNLDAYVQWAPDRQTSWRLSMQNLWPIDAYNASVVTEPGGRALSSQSWRSARRVWLLSLAWKL